MFYFDLELNEEFETDLEQSKFFGEISLPERFLSSDEFSPDEMFVCQINLSEVRLYFKDFLLPSVGRLLFFIDLKKKRPIVRYINEECEAYTSFNDDLDFDIDYSEELTLSFSDKSDYTAGEMLFSDEKCDGLVCLLKVYHFLDEPLLPLDGSAYFLIDENDLRRFDFSNIKLKIIK